MLEDDDAMIFFVSISLSEIENKQFRILARFTLTFFHALILTNAWTKADFFLWSKQWYLCQKMPHFDHLSFYIEYDKIMRSIMNNIFCLLKIKYIWCSTQFIELMFKREWLKQHSFNPRLDAQKIVRKSLILSSFIFFCITIRSNHNCDELKLLKE